MRAWVGLCAKQHQTRLFAMMIFKVTYLCIVYIWRTVVSLVQRQAYIFFRVWRNFANIHGKLKMLVEVNLKSIGPCIILIIE